jgi:hypothetical protein
MCPNCDAPGIRATAAKAFAEFCEKARTRRENRKQNRPVNYNALSDENKKKVKEAILASMASDTSASAAAASPPGCKKLMILVAEIFVLSSDSPTCNILPTPILSNFPHIHLQFGTELGCANCPVIHCVVDTAAALSTGNFHFVAAVAKQYAHCVAKLIVPKD